MGRKFINRRSDAEKEKIAAEDEWAHITNLGDDGRQLDIQDVLDVQDRSIFLNKEAQEPQTHWEKTKEATRNAMDRAGNTSQYIKYVNHHFEKQKSAINKVKEIKANYDREVKLLQNDDNSLINTVTNNTPENHLLKLKQNKEKELKMTINHIDRLRADLASAENELKKKELEFNEINQKITKSNTDEKVGELSSVLLELSNKLDPDKLNEVVKSLESSIQNNSEQKAVE